MAPKLKVRKPSPPTLSGAEPRAGLGSVQLGQTGLKRSYGYVYEELLPQLMGRKAISVYQEMAQNCSIIGAFLFAIDMFMRKVAWNVEAASDSPVDQERAKYVESCKDDMEMSWPDFISEVNSMLPFGWSWFEICYKQRFNDVVDEFGTTQSKFNDGLYGWQKFMPIAQESWWRWDFSPATGQTIGMWQRPAPDYSERYLPMGKSLHFRTKSWKDNPEGVSVLRTAYRAWYFLKRIEEIEAIGVERDLAGIPIATVPAEMLGENASEADQAMVQSVIKLVQNVRRDEQEGIVWPQAYDQAGHELYSFKLLTSGGTRQFPTQEIITRYESRIAMTVLADFLLLGNDASNNGSYALSTSKASMFQSAIETWLNGIENELNNRAIPLLFRMNGINNGPYPKFRHDIVQKPTLTDLATLISSMAGAGAQLFPDTGLENHLREFAKLPIREENEQNEQLELKIIRQQLDTLLSASEAEQEMSDRTALDANAEGLVPVAQGSIVPRPGALSMKAPAGAAGAPSTGAQSPAQGAAAAAGGGGSKKAVGVGGKQKGSKPGAPTKSTGPVKSKQPPAARRATIQTRAAQNAPAKSTGGLKNRSVAKHFPGQDTAAVRDRVMRQMAPDFPKSSMKWMKDATWTGPEMIPAEMFDTADEKAWAASHEPEKVKAFVKKVEEGRHKPIVAAHVPGSHKLRIIDGHHHYLAYRKLGYPVPVYVAHVDQNSGPWDEMHSYQRVSDSPDSGGYEPGDKGGGSVAKAVKLSKSEVHYRPSIGARNCGNCSMFRSPNGCTLVKGIISPDDVCDRFDAKSKKVVLKVRNFGDVVDALAKNFPPVTMVKVKHPLKKCDYCQRPEKNRFMQGDDSILHRTCDIHVPQGKAETRWMQENQVSPVNGSPNAPFPRVITQ